MEEDEKDMHIKVKTKSILPGARAKDKSFKILIVETVTASSQRRHSSDIH